MRTRISSRRNSMYELVIDDGTTGDERKVLAGMTLFEGTGLWMLTDIRLHQHRTPSSYSGGLFSDDMSCHFEPQHDEESRFVQGLLREFTVDEDGEINWSSFEGLVRGPRQGECSWSDTGHNGIGYFSKAEGLAYLTEVQKFWDAYEGGPADAKIENPHRQLTQSDVWFRVWTRRRELEASPSGSVAVPAPPAPRRSPRM